MNERLLYNLVDLRALRAANFLTRKALAARAGVCEDTLRRIESRHKRVTVSTLLLLATAFDLPPHALVAAAPCE